MGGHGGHRENDIEQETDQSVLTITKALTKTTNCPCRAEKVEGHDNFSGTLRRTCAPTLISVPAPLCDSVRLCCSLDPILILPAPAQAKLLCGQFAFNASALVTGDNDGSVAVYGLHGFEQHPNDQVQQQTGSSG